MGWRDAPIVAPARGAAAQPQATGEPEGSFAMPTDPTRQAAVQRGWDQQQFPPESETAPAVPPEPAAAGDPGWLASFGQGAAQGITFGFGDEILAGLKTGFGLAGDFGKELGGQRKAVDDAQKAHPTWFLAGNVAGALPTVALPGGAAIRGAATVGGKIAAGAAVGAATGAINGAGTADGTPGDMVKGAAVGAGVGAVAGGAAVPVGAVVGAGVRKGAQAIAGVGRTPPAIRKVGEAYARDAVEQGAPVDANTMLADMGPNLRQQAESITQMPGKGQKIVRDAVGQRADGAGDRVRGAMDDAFGGDPNIPRTMQELERTRSAAATPLYEEAYAAGVPWKGAEEFITTPAGRIVMGTPAGREALKTAQKLAANEGAPIGLQNMDVRGLDYVKQALDDQISTLQRSGANKEARAVILLRGMLINEIDRVSPEYAAARAAWAGPSAAMDAMEAGKSAFTRTLGPDELAEELSGLSPTERDAYVLGARAAVSQIMGTARNDAAAAVRELADRGWNREKLGLLLGQEQADRLLGALQTERTFQQTAQAVTGNSRTAAREAGMGDFGRRPAKISEGYVNGGILGLLRGMGLRALGGGLSALHGREIDQMAEEAARVLTATGSKRQALERVLQAHVDRVNAAAKPPKFAEGATRALIGAGANTQVAPHFVTGRTF